VNKTVKYRNKWSPIQNALTLFDSYDDILAAAKDQRIRIRGRVQDTFMQQELEEYKILAPEVIADFNFDEITLTLDNSNHSDGIFRNFASLEVSADDLIKVWMNKRYSKVSNEFTELVKSNYLEIFMDNPIGQYPSSNEVLRLIEHKIKNGDTAFKLTISSNNRNNETVFDYMTMEGKPRSLGFAHFKNMVSNLNKMAHELFPSE
tara:strand:+ start:1258 stop:1872 length:615 start_codon:yes stop_codon:yes gene_type:complete